MSFVTAINCMDGRTQLPVNLYLAEHYHADYVDTITEPGPVRALAEGDAGPETESILRRVDISVDKHGSNLVAVVAHHDCAGNPLDRQPQEQQLVAAVDYLRGHYPDVSILGLWVNETWEVEELIGAGD